MRERTDAEWIIRLIQPHVDEYKKLAADYAALAAENERLRKAGEMLFECIEPDIDDIGYNYGFKHKHAEARDAWNAAKEGRDAK